MQEGDEDVADLLRGDVAVLEAAKRGSLEKMRKLLTPDNVNCRDSHGRNSTPLHLAGMFLVVSIHRLTAIQLLTRDININDL